MTQTQTKAGSLLRPGHMILFVGAVRGSVSALSGIYLSSMCHSEICEDGERQAALEGLDRLTKLSAQAVAQTLGHGVVVTSMVLWMISLKRSSQCRGPQLKIHFVAC
jgi:hypothetical protein